MDPQARAAWQDEALDFVLIAIGAAAALRESLVFRGARILDHHLDGPRRPSLDLDAVLSMPATSIDRTALEEDFLRALRDAAEAMEPVIYAPERVQIALSPRLGNARGWDGLKVAITLRDLRRAGTLGIPVLTMDLAAPEQFGEGAVERRVLADGYVLVCSNHNLIAGKLRAFLESTAFHRTKLELPHRPLRVKDLVDLARVWDVYCHEPDTFWHTVAQHFATACACRLVECEGWRTFARLSEAAREAYEVEPMATASGLSFEETWERLELLVGRIMAAGALPGA